MNHVVAPHDSHRIMANSTQQSVSYSDLFREYWRNLGSCMDIKEQPIHFIRWHPKVCPVQTDRHMGIMDSVTHLFVQPCDVFNQRTYLSYIT